MSDQDQVLKQAVDWLADGKGVALATVVGTWGSSPRPIGSQLAVADDGAFVGSVSGGCVEGAVVKEALETINQGNSRLLEFGVSDEQAWEVGLACGGEMKVFVEKAPDSALLNRLITERPLALATHLDSGALALIDAEQASGGLDLDGDTLAAARRALDEDRSTTLESAAGPVFVNVFGTPLRMIIIGAVHIAQSLAPMARMAGFAVTVIDPRRAFATDERFQGITLRSDWPDEALEELVPDNRTAVVTLTHDPKLDDPALEIALKSDVFYIGSLGSRKTHAKRLGRLRDKGFDEETLGRIHAPIGFDLGGRKAPEIAVSVLAQVIAARYGKDGG